ncbi:MULTISPECIES: hypothetical protein [Actinosynnema]|uniref:hypothetical protein n=1 Tax=Actinosynnema TaxID=40566 RepID=UPI0020A2902E|nr:hypothetical protein [Actinosynnema pretiosum]MCP2094687.1 hypothetical protein [Actinosynnema pretiosum]
MEGPAWLRALPDELAARVVEANALASAPGAREVDGEDAVRLACDLIIAGVDAPEVVDLACQPCDVDGLTASVLLRTAMDALGLPGAG